MEWFKAYLVGIDLFHKAQFIYIFAMDLLLHGLPIFQEKTLKPSQLLQYLLDPHET
jgi:hypothetical protein